MRGTAPSGLLRGQVPKVTSRPSHLLPVAGTGLLTSSDLCFPRKKVINTCACLLGVGGITLTQVKGSENAQYTGSLSKQLALCRPRCSYTAVLYSLCLLLWA